MNFKIGRHNLFEDTVYGNQPNIRCAPLPNKFLWSEDAKLRYQEAFHTSEVEVKKNILK